MARIFNGGPSMAKPNSMQFQLILAHLALGLVCSRVNLTDSSAATSAVDGPHPGHDNRTATLPEYDSSEDIVNDTQVPHYRFSTVAEATTPHPTPTTHARTWKPAASPTHDSSPAGYAPKKAQVWDSSPTQAYHGYPDEPAAPIESPPMPAKRTTVSREVKALPTEEVQPKKASSSASSSASQTSQKLSSAKQSSSSPLPSPLLDSSSTLPRGGALALPLLACLALL